MNDYGRQSARGQGDGLRDAARQDVAGQSEWDNRVVSSVQLNREAASRSVASWVTSRGASAVWIDRLAG